VSIPQLEPGWINTQVTLKDTWTPAVRFGGLIDAALSVTGALALGLALWARRKLHVATR
jgi:hypothetical protein